MKRVAATMAVLLALVSGFGWQPAWAEIPRIIAYQGVLTDSTGIPLNGNYTISVKIYTTPTDGTPLWTESHVNTTVSKGVFSVMLGSVKPFFSVPALTFDSQYYLGISIDNGLELTPRVRLASVATAIKALNASSADKLDGLNSTAFARSSHSHTKQMFTESGSFEVPAGVTSVYITGVGGGADGAANGSGGGGGASIIAKKVEVTPGTIINVTVNDKLTPGPSSFGNLLHIPNGIEAQGGGSDPNSGWHHGPPTGIIVNGSMKITTYEPTPAEGTNGQNGSPTGVGGGSAFGTGGQPGEQGGGFGGGGGAGAAGRPGFIMVEW